MGEGKGTVSEVGKGGIGRERTLIRRFETLQTQKELLACQQPVPRVSPVPHADVLGGRVLRALKPKRCLGALGQVERQVVRLLVEALGLTLEPPVQLRVGVLGAQEVFDCCDLCEGMG